MYAVFLPGGRRHKVCIGVQIDKDCLVSPLMSGYFNASSADSNSRLYCNLDSYFGEFNYWPS